MNARDYGAAVRAAASLAAGTELIDMRLPGGFFDLEGAAEAASRSVRPVRLTGLWWRDVGESLLVFVGTEAHPAALLPTARGALLRDPAQRLARRVTPALAAQIAPDAYTFDHVLPLRAAGLGDLVRLGWPLVSRDALRLIGLALAAAALSLLIPLVSSYLFSRVIPDGDLGQLLLVAAILLISAVSLAGFDLAHVLLLQRTRGRLDQALGVAVWRRLLSLPLGTVRRFAAGDLAERALGVREVQLWAAELAINTLETVLFAGANLVLMLLLAPALAVIALMLVALAVISNLAFGVALLHAQRDVAQQRAAVASTGLELLEGAARLQIAGATARGLAQWQRVFFAQRRAMLHVGTWRSLLITFNSGYPVIAMLVVIALSAQAGLDTAAFLAFNVSFSQVLSVLLGWARLIVQAQEAQPALERLRPLLQAVPERDAGEIPALSGEVSLHDVWFRYAEDGPWVLAGVSLDVRPGEWVALTGPVGCGKSTLLRLLLGFEQPQRGMVSFDGQPLEALSAPAVRRQLGAVLQSGMLMTGTLGAVIADGRRLSPRALWEAVSLAALDDDVRDLPMGLDTVISESGTNFSGGQMQRVRIARAIAGSPPILLLDEATSALDDAAQGRVMAGLRSLGCSCIMIAHRLETVAYADRVLRLENGRLVRA